MKERPILFSAPMVNALLTGAKTQTRRPVKCKPWQQIEERDDGTFWPWMHDNARDDDYWLPCPYGQAGDRLWVRETWAHGIHALAAERDEDGPFVYAADGAHALQGRLGERWRPSIFMPRAASRISLVITDIRVERLQDISRGNAMGEGCPFPNMANGPDPRQWYANLWEEINGTGSWDQNPWVWCLGFEKTKA